MLNTNILVNMRAVFMAFSLDTELRVCHHQLMAMRGFLCLDENRIELH